MKKVLILALILSSGIAFADGKQLVKDECMMCHVVDGQGGEKKSAPPMYAVWHHYRQAHADKESFVAAITTWLQQPQKEKSVMKGAIKKMGLMEKLEITEAQAHSVAEYLYERDFDLPEWYLVHYNKKHGTKEHGYDEGTVHAQQGDHQQSHQH